MRDMTEIPPPHSDGPASLRRPKISFEFSPPKTEEMERNLWETINRLAPLAPSFVSVTYGAGGSTRERTHSTVSRILNETHLLPAAHLTCGGAASGVGTSFVPHPDGYQTSPALVAGIRKRHPDIEISVSAYPEKHPEARDLDTDIDTLKAKVDAGASRAITQVFFDNDLYFRYLDRVRARGINIPI